MISPSNKADRDTATPQTFRDTYLFTEVVAAEALGLSIKTLRNWRVSGNGPAFVKLGRSVRYRRYDIETYISVRLRASTSTPAVSSPCRSTSQEG